MKYQPKLEKEIMCPIEYGLGIFGGKWKSRILCVLSSREPMRYNADRKALGNITDAVLAAMLKELAADGLVHREQYNEIPLRVEYIPHRKGGVGAAHPPKHLPLVPAANLGRAGPKAPSLQNLYTAYAMKNNSGLLIY